MMCIGTKVFFKNILYCFLFGFLLYLLENLTFVNELLMHVLSTY